MGYRHIFYALTQALNLAGVWYLFTVYYELLTNEKARNLDCLLHLPLVFYATCFQFCILPYENPEQWLQGETNCDDRSFVIDFIYYFFSFGMIPGIIVIVHVPFLVFWKARTLKHIEKIDVLKSFLRSVGFHVLMIAALVYSSARIKPTHHTYDLDMCGIDPLILSIFCTSYLVLVFVFFLFIWFNGLKIFLGSLSGQKMGLLSVAGISLKSKQDKIPKFLNDTARSMFFTFSTVSDPSESSDDSDLLSNGMARNSNFEPSSSFRWPDEFSSSSESEPEAITPSVPDNNHLDLNKTIKWNLNGPMDSGNLFLGVSVIEPGAFGRQKKILPSNLNSDLLEASSPALGIQSGYKGLMTKPKTAPARVAPYRPSKKLLTPSVSGETPFQPTPRKQVRFQTSLPAVKKSFVSVEMSDSIPIPNKPSSLDESGASLPGPLASLELQDSLSLIFSTSVMQLAHVAKSMKVSNQGLSDSEIALMQTESNHVFSADSIRVVNTFDGIFLKACSFIFVTLFVLIFSCILESMNVSAPLLYNIGLLLRQSAIVLSAHIFFQSTSLQKQPDVQIEPEDIEDTGVAGNKETALYSSVSLVAHSGSFRGQSHVEQSRLTSIKSDGSPREGEDSSFSSGIEMGWVDQSMFLEDFKTHE